MEVVRNCDVEGVVYAVPRGHRHYRLAVFLRGGRVLVFSEAFVANVVRAYVSVHTHPARRAVALKQVRLGDMGGKEGYAECQLLETEVKEGELEEKIGEILDSART